jgi:heme A synthase
MLFSDRSLWTMAHGIVLGGGALMAIAAAMVALYVWHPADGGGISRRASRAVAQLTALVAALLWAAVLTGTYIVFPPYRATPPAGTTDLSAYPRSMLLADPGTAWLHAFAMESKEHMPWIAAMLATAVMFAAGRVGVEVFTDQRLRRMMMTLLAVCFVLVSFTALMGTFVNKVAPLE